ncbi:hypothetical protein WDJ50_09990 [Deinococcus sp. VB142]|uniref:Uncharacterized protein n=1 Tax=Deinococcus sp. VB142 TaxID=3112952 RepID=A0AAU6Q0F6_9DEIO
MKMTNIGRVGKRQSKRLWHSLTAVTVLGLLSQAGAQTATGQPPLECKNTMYGLVKTSSTASTYRLVQSINPTTGAASGNTLWTVPVATASLGITPDGARLFAAAYNSATLYYRDITLGISGSVTIPGYSSSNGVLPGGLTNFMREGVKPASSRLPAT